MAHVGRTVHEDQHQTAPKGGTAGGRGPMASANPAGTHPISSLPGPAPNTAGPHTNDLLNKLDPTVDSQHGGVQVLGPGTNVTSHERAGPQSAHTSMGTTAPKTTAAGPHSSSRFAAENYPPHSSNLANKLDPQVDTSNTRGPPQQHTGAIHQGMPAEQTAYAPQGSHGMHNAHTGNTLDHRYDSNLDHRGQAPASGHNGSFESSTTNSVPPGTAGPHNSRVANALDPRVNDRNTGAHEPMRGGDAYDHPNQGPYPHQGAYESMPREDAYDHPRQGASSTQGQSKVAPGTAGPHNSRVANALDPRVNDRETAANAPMQSQGAYAHHEQGAYAHQGQGDYARQGHGAYGPQTTGAQAPLGSAGPHDSRFANTVDPRYDSDRQHGQAPMQGQDNHGHPGNMVQAGQGTAGPHNSRVANALDPRYDSNAHSGANAPTQGHNTTIHQGPTVHPGPASKTAGPHKSNLLNKLDPAVDSKATVTQQREYRIS